MGHSCSLCMAELQVLKADYFFLILELQNIKNSRSHLNIHQTYLNPLNAYSYMQEPDHLEY